MTKRQLIKELEKYPDDMIICGWDNDWKSTYPFVTVIKCEYTDNGHGYHKELNGQIVIKLE